MTYLSGEAIARAFFDRWNQGDADGIGDLFVEDADFVNVVGIWWQRRSQIRKAHEYGFRKIFGDSYVNITELKARKLTDNIEIVHTVSTLDGQTGPSDEVPERRIAVISMVTVRQGMDGFRIVSCQNTDRVEGMDTHVRSQSELRPVKY